MLELYKTDYSSSNFDRHIFDSICYLSNNLLDTERVANARAQQYYIVFRDFKKAGSQQVDY